jgi:hypothetical protein
MNLLNLAPTAAISPAAVTPWMKLNAQPRNLTAQFNFTYGSGGTSIDAYLQVSLDGGLTATDVANFHVTTSSVRKAVNLNAQTPEATQVVLTDGSMTANTAQDGILGPLIRVKYQSSGTYAASTLTVDVQSDQIPSFP